MEPKLDLSNISILNLEEPDDDNTITLSGFKYSNTVIGGGYTSPNIAPSGITVTAGTGIASPWVSTTAYPYLGNGVCTDGNNSGKIKLTGENADVEINGISLVESIRKIEERLNILAVNTELETEWEELRELGNRYRELEQHIKEKQATWDRLKAMPKPEID